MHCTVSDLHVAIYARNVEIVKQCVKNPNIINSFWRGCTPVSSAIYLKRYEILQVLVRNSANVNLCTRNNKMEPPLFAACRLRDHIAINMLLDSPCIDMDQCDFFGKSALWAAARYCTSDIVELLLNRGAKLNMSSTESLIMFPINAAVEQNKKVAKNIVHLLIVRGSVLDSITEENLLQWAIKYADRDIFCLLVSAGCKVKCEDWLSYDKLPSSWQGDTEFCNWIESLKRNPPSLLNLSACCIRNILSIKWPSLTFDHVKMLKLPNSLTNLLLFHC